MKVKWKDNSRFKATAGAAYNFFERIREENEGQLDWDKAEKAARLKGCPIHNDLEWDDKRCGRLFRIDQMKRMVRKLEYIPAKMDTPVRVYESIRVEVTQPDKDSNPQAPKVTQVYQKTEDILADPAGRADLLGQAVRDALAFRRRYAALSELATVIDAIDETVKKLA